MTRGNRLRGVPAAVLCLGAGVALAILLPGAGAGAGAGQASCETATVADLVQHPGHHAAHWRWLTMHCIPAVAVRPSPPQDVASAPSELIPKSPHTHAPHPRHTHTSHPHPHKSHTRHPRPTPSHRADADLQRTDADLQRADAFRYPQSDPEYRVGDRHAIPALLRDRSRRRRPRPVRRPRRSPRPPRPAPARRARAHPRLLVTAARPRIQHPPYRRPTQGARLAQPRPSVPSRLRTPA